MFLNEEINMVFSLVSVCCDTAQALACVFAGVSVLWHSPSLGLCFCWGQCVVTQPKPWSVFLLGSVCCDTAQALACVFAGVSVLWHSPSFGLCFCWGQCVVTQPRRTRCILPWFVGKRLLFFVCVLFVCLYTVDLYMGICALHLFL